MAAYSWRCVTARAQFPGMDGAGALALDGKLFLLGGWNPTGSNR
jgi:hypothetical protein